MLGVLALCLSASSVVRAAEPTYWQDVRPVLRKNCTVCHNARNLDEPDVSGGLALDTFEAVRKGGKIAVVKPGDGAESLLVTILRHRQDKIAACRAMPIRCPTRPSRCCKAWIDAGAKEGHKPVETDVIAGPRAARSGRQLDVVLPTKFAESLAKTGSWCCPPARWPRSPPSPSARTASCWPRAVTATSPSGT